LLKSSKNDLFNARKLRQSYARLKKFFAGKKFLRLLFRAADVCRVLSSDKAAAQQQSYLMWNHFCSLAILVLDSNAIKCRLDRYFVSFLFPSDREGDFSHADNKTLSNQSATFFQCVKLLR
jgi:hypothetical protein